MSSLTLGNKLEGILMHRYSSDILVSSVITLNQSVLPLFIKTDPAGVWNIKPPLPESQLLFTNQICVLVIPQKKYARQSTFWTTVNS